MTRRRFKLTIVAPLLVGLILAFVFTVVFVANTRAGGKLTNQSIKTSGRAIVSTSSGPLFNSLYHLDASAISIMLDRLVRDPNIVHAVVRDRTGKIISEATDGWAPEEQVSHELALQALAQRDIVQREIGQYIVLSAPIAAGPQQIGTLGIAFDPASPRALFSATFKRIYFTIIPLFIGIVLLVIMLTRYIIKPIQVLTATAEEIRGGNLDAQVPVRGAEEIAVLGNAMERMRAELKRLYLGLDQLVVERTAELTAVNQELEAFSYSVSHDLRSPLRSIDGFSQALLVDYADKLDTQGKDHLQRVRAASQRMGQLIDDLLNLSRVTRREMRRETVELSALAQSVASELQRREPERQVTFATAEGIVVNGDPHLLRVVLENFLGNAWKFTGKHPQARIEFGVINHNGVPAYFVRDDGAGFDMAYADKLFGAFQRLHSMTEFEGTGIGLATVQRVIHRHGGRVWAKGALEQGATFYFTLS